MVPDLSRALVAIAAVLLGAGASGAAERFPERPVRLLMPYAAGGGSDSVGRIVAQHLNEYWKQPVVVDSRLGAGGNIGTDIAAKAAPDGYTLLFNTAAMLVAPNLYKGLPFDPVRDFVPITKLGFSPAVIVIHPQVKANSIAELITLAKSQSNPLNYGSGGVGSAVHLATEQFNTMAGIRMEHVPYKGGNLALTDLMAGRIQVMYSPVGAVGPLAKAGRIKILAVTTAQLSPFAPGIPTVSESGLPGYDFSYWWGIFAPVRTPPALVKQLNADIVKVVESPAARAQLANYGVTAASSTLAQFDAEIRNERRVLVDVARNAGIKPE
jgi:tripartite-type tricarboxylate transporter receptor subunit TctC